MRANAAPISRRVLLHASVVPAAVLRHFLPPPCVFHPRPGQVGVPPDNFLLLEALVHGGLRVVSHSEKLSVRVLVVAVHQRFHALAAQWVRLEERRVHRSCLTLAWGKFVL